MLFPSILAILFICPPATGEHTVYSLEVVGMISVYTLTAAKAILGRKDIVKVDVWANCIWVRFIKGSRFMSKKDFQKFFMDSRKQRAINLEVSHYGHELFQVSSESRLEPYLVSANEQPQCECEDFANQVKSKQLKHPLCKHTWAMIKFLGFSSFSDYLKNQGWKKCETL